jgi:hypothetical protein
MRRELQVNEKKDAEASNESRRDPWFKPHLGPQGIRAHNVIGAVVLAAKTYQRKRALSGKNLDTFYRVVIALSANLIHHYLSGAPGQGIPVPRSKRDKALGAKGNRYQPFSFPRSFPKMLDALSELGFAEMTIGKYSGFPAQSKRTTVKAGARLIALIKEHKVTLEDLDAGEGEEIIILKRPKRGHWDEGKRIDYRDTAETRHFRDEELWAKVGDGTKG